MKGSIIFQNRVGGEIAFKITNEHLWGRLYHELAFLAESGRGVSYIKGGEDERQRDEREKVWNDITSNIEGIVEQRLPALIEEATKVIQDKLIVELARKAMNMEEK